MLDKILLISVVVIIGTTLWCTITLSGPWHEMMKSRESKINKNIV